MADAIRPLSSVGRRASAWWWTLAALVGLAVLAGHQERATAATPADLGHALYAYGYTATVWVNGFDPDQPYLAHGVFRPDVWPVSDPSRYGQVVTGTGSLSVAPDGFFVGSGTARNDNPVTSDGSILISVLRDNQAWDGARVLFVCPASTECPWTVHFKLARPEAGHNFTVKVERQVEGAVSGGERNIDLNGCRDKLVAALGLPPDYYFTYADVEDTNYVSRPGDRDSVLGTLILPLCAGQPTVPPVTPPVTPPITPPVKPPEPPAPPSPDLPLCADGGPDGATPGSTVYPINARGYFRPGVGSTGRLTIDIVPEAPCRVPPAAPGGKP